MALIELDGSQGEGGGQVLRTALTLSMVTGQPFHMERIRARRRRPGLLHQHMTAVKAAAEVCRAEVHGAEPGSSILGFNPAPIKGGDYHFAIGTAGSCTLVLQTVLPALWFADRPSTVTITGGTHNPKAPPADFLIRTWLPLMARMGVRTTIELRRHGFFPAGGGELRGSVKPIEALRPLELEQRGKFLGIKATAVVAALPEKIATRELSVLARRLGAMRQETRELPPDEGPGNVLMVEVAFEHITETFAGFGVTGVRAETVANRLAEEVQAWCETRGATSEHLADQLVLPIALAGEGRLTTTRVSSHLETNLAVITRFLPIRYQIDELAGAVRVSLGGRLARGQSSCL